MSGSLIALKHSIGSPCRSLPPSLAGELVAYTQTNDEGRDLQGDPIECFKAMSDPATLYYHQATKEPDHKNFKYVMVKEVTECKSNDNYDVVPTSEIPAGATVTP